MYDTEKSVYQHEETDSYRNVKAMAFQKENQDILANVNYVKENGTNHDYIMYLTDIVQQELLDNPEEKRYTFSAYEMRKFLEGVTYAINHVAPNAAIAHERMVSRSESFLMKLLEETLETNRK